MKTKKELKQEYKSKKFRKGIYQIRNKQTNRLFLQTSGDLEHAFNSDVFQLNAGLHLNKDLQNDWKTLGSEMFEFSIFDEIEIEDTVTPLQLRRELKAFLQMHIDELKKNQQLLY